MLLSQLVGKTLIMEKTPRGVCRGVSISQKNKTLKYLLCSSEKDAFNHTNFVLPIDALASFSESALFLSKLRPVLPKSSIQISTGMPIYNASGDFLGTLKDVEFQNQTAIRLITDSDISHPFTEVGALSDAIILRKAQPYPLGQIIPHKNVLITRKILRGAVEKQSLIKLTLSLPPFSMR